MIKTNSKLINLPSTKALIESHRLVANKKLGQNFLLDSNITDNIVLSAGNLNNKVVLEIGPGPGSLTRSLLATGLKQLIVVEFDNKCLSILNQISALDDRLKIIHSDALTIKEETFSEEKLTIISNLPYNIGTALVLKWLEKVELFDAIIIMLQKEVAQRITASSGNKTYGRLSILCQTLCDTEIVLEIPSYMFYPEPKVESAVIKLTPKTVKPNVDLKLLVKICREAFSQRRKKIRTSLQQFLTDADFAALAIDPNLRAEDITVEQYHKITDFVVVNCLTGAL